MSKKYRVESVRFLAVAAIVFVFTVSTFFSICIIAFGCRLLRLRPTRGLPSVPSPFNQVGPRCDRSADGPISNSR